MSIDQPTAVPTSDQPPASPPPGSFDDSLPPPPERPHWSKRARWTTAVALLVVVALVSAAFLVQLPYYTLSPGSSRGTEPLIAVDGAPTYDTGGNVEYLTVSLRRTTPIEALAAWINPDVDVVDEERILGTQTPEENRQVNLQMMSDSKDSATYQALRRLGYEIPTSGSGAVVASVQDGSPAAGVLAVGDVIVEAGGEPVELNSQLVDVIGAHAPGDVITMKVTPFDGGDARSVDVTLGAREDDPTKGFLGVSSFTKDLNFDFPVQVTIDSGSVGGPSAGLAFTLGLLDVLTPESITGGQRIATTGTMSLDGQVGPVGGVHQKVAAAKRSGVTLMLVPSSELEEARRYAGDLRVEAVDTLDQALAVLATVGGGNDVLPAAATDPQAG